MMTKKTLKRATAFGLCLAMCGASMAPVSAASKSTNKKEEVVYANLKEDGALDQCYVVNIMYPDNNKFTDYGDYTSIKNLTTTDNLTLKDNTVTGTSDAQKLYYEGYLEGANLPWNIDIHYYLDDKEVKAEDLAGKDGALKIKISIKKNKDCKKDFFKNFALQSTVTLDSDKCSNIKASGATIANVGSDKQLTYTILPNQGKDITITADVEDFEMESMAFNGIRLNLDFDFDSLDSSELTDKVNEIIDATGTLNSGAVTLDNGASAVETGSKNLTSGIAQIKSGLTTLNSKSSSLTKGSKEVKQALRTINSSLENVSISSKKLKQLSSSSTQIKSGINSLVSGLNSLKGGIDQYEKGVGGSISGVSKKTQAAISQLKQLAANDPDNASTYNNIIQLLQAGAAGEDVLNTIQGQLSSSGSLMKGAKSLQTNYAKFDSSIQDLVDSLSTLSSSMTKLKSGISLLVDNYDTLDKGISDYTEGVAKIVAGYNKVYEGAVTLTKGTESLHKGTKSLVSGTSEFKNKTSNMDSQIETTVSDLTDQMLGKDYTSKSFVSNKNKNIKSVQFVLKTDAIKK